METYHQLAKVLKENKLSTNVGNEGAFAPNGIPSNEAPFAYMLEAIKRSGYKAGEEVGLSIDAAASEFYKDGMYNLKVEKRQLTAAELIAYFETWLAKYPIATIEDMLAEDDWENWTKLKIIADKYKIPLIGDDLTVTNVERLQRAIDSNAISAILIKLNQIGTLTETVDCCMLANRHGLMTTNSHRGGGETNDATMVDVAVAVGSAFIKVGPTRGERVAKYNRLMEIERILGDKAKVSDKEFDDFLSKNKELIENEKDQTTAKAALRTQMGQQKLAQKYQEWIATVKKNAKINYLVNY
jgi:enolase